MKTKINILCILLFAFFVGLMFRAVKNGLEGGMDGMNSPEEGMKWTTLRVKPLPETTVTGFQMVEAKVGVSRNILLDVLVGPFMLLSFFAIIASCYSFVQLIRSIRKNQIFISKNVSRLRVIAYTLLVCFTLVLISKYLDYRSACSVMNIPGYRPDTFSFPWGGVLTSLLLALFAEIFAVGVKMKTEQELTI